MTDVAESCAPFPLQLHHAHLQLHLLPLPLSLTDTDSTTVLDAHVFSPLHEFGASCPLPERHDGGVRMLAGDTYQNRRVGRIERNPRFTEGKKKEKLIRSFQRLFTRGYEVRF